MSKQWIYSIGLSSLVMFSLSGWGNWREQRTQVAPTAESSVVLNEKFPLAKNQGWFTEESYLILKPNEDNLWYSSKVEVEGNDVSVKKQAPDFGWYSGVRLVVGRYLPKHDHWDVTFATTYYYANTEDDTHLTLEGSDKLDTRWNNTFTSGLNTSEASWRLNYFTWDLSIARLYQMTKSIAIHPLVGLRATYITQDYDSKATGTSSGGFKLTEKFDADNNMWGIGPRLGTGAQFNFGRHWSLLGNLTGSVLIGSYKVTETVVNTNVTDGNLITENDHLKENAYAVRANVEGSFGLGWEKWFKNNSVRVAPSFLFEATEWFNINQFFSVHKTAKPTDDVSLVKKVPSSGSLGLMGFSVNLQVDF